MTAASDISVSVSQFPVVALKKKRSLLPVLTLLFVLSYVLMTYLIIEQAKTIESQRGLIRTLFGDSIELTTMKGKAVMERNAAAGKARAQEQEHSPAEPGHKTQSDHKSNEGKVKKHALPKVPQAASDKPDVRRALRAI
ncbi:MAG TPA: hypothetical protein VFA89_12115 [Terriglobales bacterium]|nr:hypothetical protein [Terriglobales bacterium]